MFNPRNKIVRGDNSSPPSDVENEVAKCLTDIESSNSSELKNDVREITFCSAKEVDLPQSRRKAVVIYVPYSIYQTRVKRILGRLIVELEKKMKKHVVIIAKRTILSKNFKRKGLKVRPRNRCLTSVQDSALEDIVAPTEIIQKRQKMKKDGSNLLVIHLDPKDKQKDNIEEKLETFAAVYKSITNKDASFIFPATVY